MGNTKLGGAKVAARRLGITVEEYQGNIKAGFKWCSTCRNFLYRDSFNNDGGTIDGKDKKCKSCSRAKDRRRYKPVPIDQQKPRGLAVYPPTDGDKRQARNRINSRVKRGILPRAQTIPCTDCGHIGTNIPHEYDHYLGYAAINHLQVQCVCFPCHRKREQQRQQNKQEE